MTISTCHRAEDGRQLACPIHAVRQAPVSFTLVAKGAHRIVAEDVAAPVGLVLGRAGPWTVGDADVRRNRGTTKEAEVADCKD